MMNRIENSVTVHGFGIHTYMQIFIYRQDIEHGKEPKPTEEIYGAAMHEQ